MAEYATIELIDNKVALVRAKTKSGRLLPTDIDTTTIDQAMTDILKFVQAHEPTEVEEALQIKEQANQKVVFEGKVYESTIDNNVRVTYRIPSRLETSIINISNGGGIWKFKAIIYQ